MPSGREAARQALRAQVLATLRGRALLDGGADVLVACSGGPDSQALLHVLHALAEPLGLRLRAASVHHGLRPDAQRDVDIAGRLAEELGVPFACLRVTVPAGASRQAQAREVRYRALLEHAQAHHIAHVAVGHTLDDQAETVLERLLRGTGVEGLAAVTPRRADGVIRPLLDARRALVRAYVAEVPLEVAEDPSNVDDRYLRSRVRHSLLPALSVENPRLAEHLAALAEDARELGQLVRAEAGRAMVRADGDFRVLSEESPPVRRSALKQHVESAIGTALRRTHLVALERMLTVGGQVRLPGDYVASLDERGAIAFAKVAKRGRGFRRRSQGRDS